MLPSSFEGSIFLLILANVNFLIISNFPSRCVRFQHLTIVKFLIPSVFSSWFTQHTEYAHEHADTIIKQCKSHRRSAQKNSNPHTQVAVFLEVPPGFGPGNEGFADLCLTTWLWHLNMER